MLCFALILAACGNGTSAPSAAHATPSGRSNTSSPRQSTKATHVTPDPCPNALRVPQPVQGSNGWGPIGRLVSGCSALYETHVGSASIVWLDRRLLSFTLYSGSLIPGRGPVLHTAPISEPDGLNLVAAFNSGQTTR
jgi:hypothetical protein